MNAVRATWTNGQIIPAEAVTWPEGSQLLVEPIEPATPSIGLTEEQWRDDPESIAAWIAAVDKIEPLAWADGEEDEFDEYRRHARQFNLDAMRKQMEQRPDGGSR